MSEKDNIFNIELLSELHNSVNAAINETEEGILKAAEMTREYIDNLKNKVTSLEQKLRETEERAALRLEGCLQVEGRESIPVAEIKQKLRDIKTDAFEIERDIAYKAQTKIDRLDGLYNAVIEYKKAKEDLDGLGGLSTLDPMFETKRREALVARDRVFSIIDEIQIATSMEEAPIRQELI